jgi:hypothetical protein
MNWKDISGLLSSVAPTLAAALGGPLASTAVSALVAAFGLSAEGSTEDKQKAIVEAITGTRTTPEQLLALKQAEQDYSLKMAELGFKNAESLESISMNDRDSARKREIDVKDNTPKILAYAITLGFFGMLIFMMFHDIPAASRDVLNMLLGSLATAWISVTGYYFGTTSSSAAKTKLLAQADAIKDSTK